MHLGFQLEYTELADYPVPTGRLTEWVPSVDDTHWNVDNRPLSPNHSAHLTLARSAPDDAQGSWIGTAFRLPGPFDAAAFGATLRRWIDRHDAFRTTAEFTADGLVRTTVPSGTVTLATRVHEQIPGSGVYRHLERLFATAISPLRWPHMIATTIEPESAAERAAGTTVIVAADHSVMDAYSQLLLITELREIYRATTTGDQPALPPCGSYVEHCAAERAAAADITADHAAVVAWRDFWHAEGTEQPAMPRFPMPTQPDAPGPGPGWQSSLSRWLLSVPESDAFAAACKRHGASASSGAFAALTIALARLTGRRSARFVMPMHTRTTAESFAAVGWYVGLAPVDISLGDASSFATALAPVDTAVRRHAGVAHAPYPQIAALAGMAEPPRFTVSFVDARHLPGAATWDDRDRALRSRARNHDEVYLWINRTSRGMNVSLRFPNNEVAAASLHALITELGTVMRTVAETGDLHIDGPGSPHSPEPRTVVDPAEPR
ncbi:MAG: condensation domain-containing protein [Gordonia sp. (in: high G+C Gram-positive bacteria)]